MKCKTGDLGLFVGFTSLPLGKEKDFWEHTIRPIFGKYRDGLNTVSRSRGLPEHAKHVYDPHGYVLLSEFDLAVLSLTDDNLFTTLAFRSGEKYLRERVDEFDPDKLDTFTHVGLGGVIPNLGDPSGCANLWSRVYLESGVRPPLTLISQMKLNSILSSASGTSFVRALFAGVLNAFKEFKRVNGGECHHMHLLLSECYSWNEVILILWGDSFKLMGKFLSQIAEWTLSQLEQALQFSISPVIEQTSDLGQSAPHGDPGSTEYGFFTDQPLVEIIARSLGRVGNNGRNNHVFETSVTYGGFDMELYRELSGGAKATQVAQIWPEDRILVTRRWFAKRGHLKDGFLAAHNDGIGQISIRLCFEKGDFFHKFEDSELSTFDVIKEIVTTRVAKGVQENLMRATTLTGLVVPVDRFSSVSDDHIPCFESLSSILKTKAETAKRIFDMCKRLGLPKVLTTKVQNCLSALNEGLQDRVMMPFFYDLACFSKIVDATLETIKNIDSTSGENVTKKAMPSGPALRNLVPNPACGDAPVPTVECVPRLPEVPPQVAKGEGNGRNNAEMQQKKRNAVQDLWHTCEWFEVAYRNRIHSSNRQASEGGDASLDFKGGVHQLVTAIDWAFKSICEALSSSPNVFACVGSVAHDNVSPTAQIRVNDYSVRFNYMYLFQPEFAAMSLVHEAGHYFRGFPKVPKVFPTNGQYWFLSWQAMTLRHLPADGLRELIMCRLADNVFLSDISADLVNYYFTFGRDTHLMQWWYEGYSWQNHLHAGEFQNRRAELMRQKFLLRCLSVAYVARREDFEAMTVDPSAKDFIRSLFASGRGRSLGEWLKNCNEIVSRRFADICESELASREKAEEYARQLHEGIVCDIGDVRGLTPEARCAFVCRMFYAFLLLVRERNPQPIWEMSRGDQGQPKLPDEIGGGYFFDPRGGVFVVGPENRRRLHMWRMAFYLSLWDVANKSKAQKWLDALSKNLPEPPGTPVQTPK